MTAARVMLPAWPLLSAFLVASFVLAVTPGPGVLYVVTRSLTQGRLAGLASVAGVALGNLGNAVGAAVGLAAVFAASSAAFTLAKYAGALYLVHLGIQAMRAPAADGLVALAPSRAAGRYVTGSAFIGLGLFTALAGTRSGK